MASFDIAQKYVAIKEGVYNSSTKDNGNYNSGKAGVGELVGTKYGVAAFTLSAWLGRPATKSDMMNLSYETALKIFKKNYWDAIGGDKLKNQSIATLLYDGAINQGVGAMQGIVATALGMKVSIPFQQTVIDAINSLKKAKEEEIFNKIGELRIARYNATGYGSKPFIDRVKGIAFSTTELAKKNPITTIAIAVLGTSIILGLIFRKKIISKLNF